MGILIKHRDILKSIFYVLIVGELYSMTTENFIWYIIISLLIIGFLPFLVLSLHEKEEILERSIKYILLTDIRLIRSLLFITGHMVLYIPYVVRGKIYIIPSLIYWGILFSIPGGFPEYIRYLVEKYYSEKGGE